MKNLLIVIDMQNDFINGVLGFDKADLIIPKVIEKIKKYEENGDDIIFTLDTHQNDYLETVEGKNLPLKHCIKGTLGHEIHKSLKPFIKNHLILEKPTFGSFKLGEIIQNKNYKNIELCGLVSNICVISNAIIVKAASPCSEILVDAKTTTSNNLDMQNIAFNVMKNLHINIQNFD